MSGLENLERHPDLTFMTRGVFEQYPGLRLDPDEHQGRGSDLHSPSFVHCSLPTQ